MNEATEEAASVIAVVGVVRENLARSREPAHFYGLVRGLDIARSTLRDSHDLRASVRELRERAARLTSVDTYRSSIALGLELASDLTIRCLDRYSYVATDSRAGPTKTQRVKMTP